MVRSTVRLRVPDIFTFHWETKRFPMGRGFHSGSFRRFAVIAQYTDITVDYLPLTFMLGFFVNIVVARWKDMFENIGFVDKQVFQVFMGSK